MSVRKVDEKVKGNGSTVYYQQLQSEYNDLLKRYAQAENTIDKLKTGAKIRLYTDPQDTKPNTCVNSEKLKRLQRIDFPRASQAVMSNVSACEDNNGVKPAGVRDRRTTSEFEEFQGSSTPGNSKQDDSLLERIQSLKENVDSLENYLRESDVTPTILNEVSGICKELEEDHKELCRELKTYKHSPFIPSSQSETFGFTGKKDLDKELYRIGLRLKEIQQEIARRKGKASPLDHTERAKEPISRRVISPKTQGASALDPDLTNLLSKLKDQQDAIARTNKEILRSCSPDLSKDSPFEGLRTEEPRRGRASSSSSSESRDVVDARYLTASPVPEYGLHEDLGNEDERYSSDHLAPENDEMFEEVPQPVNTTRTFASSYHDSPSQQKKPSHSIHDHRHRAGSLDKSRRPMTRNREKSHSSEDLAKDKCSRPLNPLSHPGTKTNHENGPSHHSEGLPNNPDPFNENKAEKNGAPPVRDERGKSISMSSLVDSSRMSTPLFHPRGVTRVSPRDHQGGTRTGTKHSRADGFDSGFVGSEESRSSRMATESPDIMQKLSFSYPWDSNSHLDLVSEIDEDGDSAASHDHLSTTYEHVTETARSPVVGDRSPPRDTAESTLPNSSPSPQSSPVRTRRKPARYFGYSTSRGGVKGSSSESSLPGPHVQLSDPTLSRISEKTSSERSSRVERRSGASGDIKGRKYNRPGFQESTPNVTRQDHNALNPRKPSGSVSDERTGDDKNERDPLFSLRHDINGLRNQIKNLLNEPRVTVDMYDDLRRQDEQFRRTLERRYERKLDELRESIDRLAEDLARTSEKKSRQTTRDRNSYDDFRSQVKTLTEKLDELSELRSANRPVESDTADKDDIGERVRSLAHKVDGLRLRVESDDKQNTRIPTRYFCHLCDEVSCSHHGFNSVLIKRKPPTSTPLLSEIYETSRRQRTNDLKNRPTFRHLSSTYPGVQTRSPVIHHIHTYHRTPTRRNDNYESDSNSEEELSTRRSRHRNRRLRWRRLDNGEHLPLAEANQAARDVQRLSKNMLRKMSLDLASFKT